MDMFTFEIIFACGRLECEQFEEMVNCNIFYFFVFLKILFEILISFIN